MVAFFLFAMVLLAHMVLLLVGTYVDHKVIKIKNQNQEKKRKKK